MNDNKINLKKLTLRNFLSYGNSVTEFEFITSGSVLIKGLDLDNTETGSGNNGTGKTTLLNAISYALYDSPVTEISTKDMLINNINKKKMQVTLEFEKRGKTYLIERFRKMKTTPDGTGVRFSVRDGNTWKDISRDLKNTNSMIVDILGIPHDLFKQIVLFTATTQPFLSLPKSHPTYPCQRTMMEHLFGFTELSKKAEFLRKEKKENKNKLDLAHQDISFQEKAHENYKKLLKGVKSRLLNWDIENQKSITDLKQLLSTIDDVDFEKEQKLHNELSETLSQQNKLTTELKRLRRLCREASSSRDNLERELTHLKNDQCPYCRQKYENAEQKINEINSKISGLIIEIDDNNLKIEDLSAQIDQLEIRESELRNEITISNLMELIEINNNKKRYEEKINDCEKMINPFIEQYQEIKDNPPEPIDYTEVNKLTSLIEHQEFLIKLLTRNDSFVRKILLEKNLPFLNNRLNLYLQELGLPFKVEFTHNLEAKINRFGRELDHGNISNGQKARVNIALSFAFRDVLQKLHTPFNVCFLDEVLDFGLDPTGVVNAARLIKRKARTEGTCYYIVSHRDEVGNIFDKQITVELIDGFSRIKQ